MQNLFIGVTAIVAVIALAVGFNQNPIVQTVVGAAAGPEHTERQYLNAGATIGGGVFASSTAVATDTLTANALLRNSVIKYSATSATTGAAITLTLPASSTMQAILPRIGSSAKWLFQSGYTGAATTTTFAAGTGIDLQEPDGQNVVIGAGNYAWIECVKLPTLDIACNIDETIAAD